MNKKQEGTPLFGGLRRLALVFACILSAGVMSLRAQTPPDIHGRWEFAITSGDTQTQLDEAGQATFSTYLTQVGPSVRNIRSFTTDFVACDWVSNDNITAFGTVDGSGNVNVTFAVALPDNANFQYVFSGVFSQGTPNRPTTISGTYQRTAGGCTQGSLGTSNPDGNFVATYFPDMSGTWVGAFDPNNGTGPASVPATFTLTTNTDKTLSGTVSSPTLANANNVACLVGPVTLAPLTEGTSFAAGVGFDLFGTDDAGTKLWVIGGSTNPDGSTAAVGEDNPSDGSSGTVNDGTNNSLTAWYGISGGPCDGMGGGDAPFQLISKGRQSKKQHGHQGHQPRHVAQRLR